MDCCIFLYIRDWCGLYYMLDWRGLAARQQLLLYCPQEIFGSCLPGRTQQNFWKMIISDVVGTRRIIRILEYFIKIIEICTWWWSKFKKKREKEKRTTVNVGMGMILQLIKKKKSYPKQKGRGMVEILTFVIMLCLWTLLWILVDKGETKKQNKKCLFSEKN